MGGSDERHGLGSFFFFGMLVGLLGRFSAWKQLICMNLACREQKEKRCQAHQCLTPHNLNGRGERMGVELFLLGIKGLDLVRLVLTNVEAS